MLTGVRTKRVIVAADGAAMRPQAPVNVVDGDSSAVIVEGAGLIDLASAGVHPSAAKARQIEQWSLI